MATIKDIATRLGVSVSTVSKGLNGASDISEELRQMVLDTAVEMGYATKKSKKKENRKLAVFIENMEYETEDQFAGRIRRRHGIMPLLRRKKSRLFPLHACRSLIRRVQLEQHLWLLPL